MSNSRTAFMRQAGVKLIVVLSAFQFIAFSQDIFPTGVTPSSLNSSQVNSYEQQARESGYSQQEIDAAKRQYGLSASQTPDAKGTEKTEIPAYDQPEQVMGPDSEAEQKVEDGIRGQARFNCCGFVLLWL